MLKKAQPQTLLLFVQQSHTNKLKTMAFWELIYKTTYIDKKVEVQDHIFPMSKYKKRLYHCIIHVFVYLSLYNRVAVSKNVVRIRNVIGSVSHAELGDEGRMNFHEESF